MVFDLRRRWKSYKLWVRKLGALTLDARLIEEDSQNDLTSEDHGSYIGHSMAEIHGVNLKAQSKLNTRRLGSPRFKQKARLELPNVILTFQTRQSVESRVFTRVASKDTERDSRVSYESSVLPNITSVFSLLQRFGSALTKKIDDSTGSTIH